MTSIVKLSGTNEVKEAASSELGKKAPDQASDWESLRGLTTNVYQKRPSTRLRTALLVVFFIVTLASLGLLLHSHMPALVSLGEELSDTVSRFTSAQPTPSTATRESDLPDLRQTHSKHRGSHASVPNSLAEPADDPAFRPFYATAVIEGRRVSIRSNNNIVVLDVDNGTWKFASETE